MELKPIRIIHLALYWSCVSQEVRHSFAPDTHFKSLITFNDPQEAVNKFCDLQDSMFMENVSKGQFSPLILSKVSLLDALFNEMVIRFIPESILPTSFPASYVSINTERTGEMLLVFMLRRLVICEAKSSFRFLIGSIKK